MKLTEPQRRCLEALRVAPGRRGASPREIARALWPDSPGWNRISRRRATPAGGALGATMPMKAATLLWRLRDKGLAQVSYGEDGRGAPCWTATAAGLDALKEAKR